MFIKEIFFTEIKARVALTLDQMLQNPLHIYLSITWV